MTKRKKPKDTEHSNWLELNEIDRETQQWLNGDVGRLPTWEVRILNAMFLKKLSCKTGKTISRSGRYYED